MYVMALLGSKYFHIFFMDSVSWLHSPTCIVCGYQLADSEAFQVLAVKRIKGHSGFWADLYAFSRNSIARDAGSSYSRISR